MRIMKLNEMHRTEIDAYIREHWGSSMSVSRGRIMDTRLLPGFVAVDGDKLLGALIYEIREKECEVVILFSFVERRGVATALLAVVRDIAQTRSCRRVWLITSNDNTDAIRFYQKRGMRLCNIYIDALNEARKTLKPEMPLTGHDGIALEHEVEFEWIL